MGTLRVLLDLLTPLPYYDFVDYLASRYGISPDEVEEWPIWRGLALFHASVRNRVRDRLAYIDDRLAIGDLSKEVVYYDEKGKPIKSDGKSRVDPVGFKRHIEKLLRILGYESEGAPVEEGRSEVYDDKRKRREEAAQKLEELIVNLVAGGK